MTNGDREGRIFLCHSQTNNRFFFTHHSIPHFILEKHEKDFQKVLNTLICDMVITLQWHRRTAVRFLSGYVRSLV